MHNPVRPKLYSVGLLLALLLALLSCAVSDRVDTIDGVLELLEGKGYQIGERLDESPPYIFANDGLLVNVNGAPLLIYQFPRENKPKSLALRREGREAAEKILERGTGFWEVESEEPFYSKFNSNMFVLVGDHPDAEKLRVLFEDNL